MSLTWRPPPATGRSLSEFDVIEVQSFLSGWHPPTAEDRRTLGRWREWSEYLADYERVRAEVLARFRTRPDEEPPFAEKARRICAREGLAVLATLSLRRDQGGGDERRPHERRRCGV